MKKQLFSSIKKVLCAVCMLLASHIAGAQTGYFGTYFIDTATAGNSAGDYTLLNNTAINGDSNAIFLETPNWLEDIYDTIQTAVWYNDLSNSWNIYSDDDNTTFAPGFTANIVVPTTHGTGFQFTNTTASGSQISAAMNNTAINNNPGAVIFITHNWGTGYNGIDVYDISPVGVYYDAGSWYLYNERTYIDFAAGMSFNVFVADTTGGAAFVQTTTAGNIYGDATTIDNPLCNNDPNAVLIVTHSWNGGMYDTVPLGVWYDAPNWTIYHQDHSAMVAGETYNVLIASASAALGVSNIPAGEMKFKVYPNPASDNVSISYTISEGSDVSLKLYSTDGREVGTVYQGREASGSYTLQHDVSDLQPGSYYMVLSTGSSRATYPMVVVR